MLRVIAVLSLGLAFAGVGLTVTDGTLSVVLVAVGLVVCLASPLGLLLRSEGDDSVKAREGSSVTRTSGDGSPAISASHGGTAQIDQSSHVETHHHYSAPPESTRKAADPAIIFREPEVQRATLKNPPQIPGTVGAFLVFGVANDPPPGVKCEPGTHVRAFITLSDREGQPLVPQTPARWQDKRQPAQMSPYQPIGAAELTEETLHPNGAWHGIDSVVSINNGDEVYIWNQAGVGQRIKDKEFTIEVRVRGTNVDEARSYGIVTSDNPFIGFQVTELGKPAPSAPVPKAAPPTAATSNPWSQAALLQRKRENKQLRKALRIIGVDELSLLNRPRLNALLEGRETGMEIATAQWSAHHEHLREADDPRPYSTAAAAYRELVDLSNRLKLDGRTQALDPSERDQVARAMAAVDEAVLVLREADKYAGHLG